MRVKCRGRREIGISKSGAGILTRSSAPGRWNLAPLRQKAREVGGGAKMMEGGQRGALVVFSSSPSPLPSLQQCLSPLPLDAKLGTPDASATNFQPCSVALAPPPLPAPTFPFALADSKSLGAAPLAMEPPLVALNDPAVAGGVGNGSATVTEAEMEVEEDKKQRDREHKKRSKNWTRPETLKLIRLRTELEPRFARTGRKTELWDEIAESLQRERFCRDAQQCRDKWEKLTAGYKEVRDGVKEREDNPFYDELYPLLSGKLIKKAASTTGKEKEIFGMDSGGEAQLPEGGGGGGGGGVLFKDVLDFESGSRGGDKATTRDEEEEDLEGRPPTAKKRRRVPNKYVAVTDLLAVQSLLETVLARQQRFFRDVLEAMERKEQQREQLRLEKEEKWRAEERAQRLVFNNAMVALTQKLVGERLGVPSESLMVFPQSPDGGGAHQGGGGSGGGPKKRSKNWKRTEVLQLIKLRGEMENKFTKSTRRAALWDEVADLLKAQGIKRDGKQCREKWDKLMAEYKDVADGKRERGESHYFAELTAIVTKPPEDFAGGKNVT
ncbi:hypothetical protein SELMODRAFT_409669 [Selaginella moellendorffii]|uniref:Myb-like domain-containing protein n=2 Tax=Selaginella moellendorffii TaxID=88036 RepID=D8RC24_SELML|nr:hypothetical protein SELMODRAFT_409669 [Selaginella moellendorffii]